MSHRNKCGCLVADGKDRSVRKGFELGGYTKEFCDKHKPKPVKREKPMSDILARAFVTEWFGGCLTDAERKAVDEELQQLGWESGLSEDTYHEMNPCDLEGDE